MTELENVVTLARKELRDALRNRWFLLYTAALAAPALGFSALGASGGGGVALAGFGRTAASLVNLVMVVIPLMGLTLGALAIAAERERGSLLYLLSQPVTPLELFLGKFLGLAGALLASLLLGFGLSGAAIALRAGGADAGAFLGLAGLAFLLGLVSLALGLLISTTARRASSAVGVAVFAWLTLVFLGDLGLMGTAVVLQLDVSALLGLSLANPLSVFKLAAVLFGHGNLEVLGPAGLYAARTWEGALLPLLVALLAGWVVVPLGGGYALFRRGGAL